MPDFISEDDLDTFEGWLKYQGFDAKILAPDQLAVWRSIYDEARANRPPPLGLMNLKPGDHRYAVAVRDGSDLWLTLWVRRSPKGDVYVLIPRGDGEWNAHASYHRDGRFHSKSYGTVLGQVQRRQPLTRAFRGTEHLGAYAGHGPKSVGAICDPSAYSGVVEVPTGILGPRHGAVAVDLVEPGCEPAVPFNDVIIRTEFCDVLPWIVVRVTR